MTGTGGQLRMLSPFLLLLQIFSDQQSAATATECCKEKFTYTEEGRIDEMFVLIGEQESGESADCEGGCVFVRCVSQLKTRKK